MDLETYPDGGIEYFIDDDLQCPKCKGSNFWEGAGIEDGVMFFQFGCSDCDFSTDNVSDEDIAFEQFQSHTNNKEKANGQDKSTLSTDTSQP